ncbi:hypothetical protein [Streptosporangium sp. NPDC049376]|uniref:hypothetical protein n=1 Tax=Streptosporangium sp. NPDC049376 TaxID=3366192 RepID=UPI00378DC542
MARHVPAWIMAVVTAFLLTNVVVAPDGDRRTAPPSAVSAFMTIFTSGGTGGTARTVRAASASAPGVSATPRGPGREAEPNPDHGGTDLPTRGCRHQAPARWAGGPQCLSPLRGPGQHMTTALPSPETSTRSLSRPGAGRRETAVAAPSQSRLQVFRC